MNRLFVVLCALALTACGLFILNLQGPVRSTTWLYSAQVASGLARAYEYHAML